MGGSFAKRMGEGGSPPRDIAGALSFGDTLSLMRIYVSSAACVAIVLSSSLALAQRAATLNTGKRVELRTGAEAPKLGAAARDQMSAGKWGAAILLFDRAVELTIDPQLRRDRGICHDKLDEPFPAMDDYRAYLTARPDAPDSQRIADRLSELQEATGVAKGHINAGSSSAPATATAHSNSNANGTTTATNNTSTGSSTASVDSDTHSGTSSSSSGVSLDTSGGRTNYDQTLQSENDAAEAKTSPLRGGTGFIIGPFFDLRWGTKNGGDPLYAFGVTPRYALSHMFTLALDLGFVGTGTVGSANAASGIRALAFGEARVPLNDTVSDAVVLALGAGYERYNQNNTRIVLNAPLIRAKAGYRHVFGPRVGFEVGGVADLMFFSFDNVPVGGTGDSSTDVYLGAFAALTVGF